MSKTDGLGARANGNCPLHAFASENRLRVRVSADEGDLILGLDGEISAFNDRLLAVTVLESTPRQWGLKKRLGLQAGMTLFQDGDFEGSLVFDPSLPEQTGAAMRIARLHKVRSLTPCQRKSLVEAGRHHRFESKRCGAGVVVRDGQATGGTDRG